ncbi:MAG: hypothetical protein FWC41_10005, partial [Firmicutes bacterium]|nr:hypothetical protein [Bacillota bacterium]
KNSTKVFRDLSWVEEPCKSCKLLTKCQCGCKVDINYSDKFCIDYAVRGNIDNIIRKQIEKINSGVYDDLIFGEKKTYVKHTNKYKIFKRNKYLKLHNTNGLKLITRHQTISIDSVSFDIVSKILSENIVNEKKLVEFYKKEIEELEIRNFICNLVFAEALDVLGEVD